MVRPLPKIPQAAFATPVGAARIGTPSLPDQPNVGAPLSVAGGIIERYAESEQRTLDESAKMEALTSFVNQADKAIHARREKYDRATHLQGIIGDFKQAREGIIQRGRAGGMSEIAIAEMAQQINRNAVLLHRDERSWHTQRLHGEARANLALYVEAESDQASLRGKETIEGLEHQANIATAIRDGVNAGYITPGEGIVEAKKAQKRIRVNELETRNFDSPLTVLLELETKGAHPDLTVDERLKLRQQAESRVLFLDNLMQHRRVEADRLKTQSEKALSQDFIRRAIQGEDVSRDLLKQSKGLGDQFDNTFNSVRAISGAQARGDLFPSDGAMLQDYERRLRGVGDPLTRGDVTAAADAGRLNGTDTTRLLAGIEERENRPQRRPDEQAALSDAEQFIRRGLQIKVLGVDRMTGADNERQNSAINLATIEFYELEAQARQGRQPFDARVMAQQLVEKWRATLVPDLVLPLDVTKPGSIYGARTFEDAELAIGRRLKAGQISDLTAAFLLRAADVLPRKPKVFDVKQIKESATTVGP